MQSVHNAHRTCWVLQREHTNVGWSHSVHSCSKQEAHCTDVRASQQSAHMMWSWPQMTSPNISSPPWSSPSKGTAPSHSSTANSSTNCKTSAEGCTKTVANNCTLSDIEFVTAKEDSQLGDVHPSKNVMCCRSSSLSIDMLTRSFSAERVYVRRSGWQRMTTPRIRTEF